MRPLWGEKLSSDAAPAPSRGSPKIQLDIKKEVDSDGELVRRSRALRTNVRTDEEKAAHFTTMRVVDF